MPPAPCSPPCAPLSPLVTVIIPAYNYARYLPQAIRSVLCQSCPDFELVIVDDGSTDNTAEVVRPFVQADPRVRYLFQSNAGLSAARNTGIRYSRTAFLSFLDADDEWEPAFLERCLAAIQRLPQTFGVVASANLYCDSNGTTLAIRQRDLGGPREILQEDLILKNRFGADSVLVRREAFAQCGLFDETLRSSEDRDMWIRLAGRFRIQLLPESLVRVRRHGENMSRNSNRMRENMRQVLRKAQQEQGVWRHPLFWLKVAAYFRVQNAWMLYPEGRRGAAIRDMVVSLALWPFFLHPSSLDEPVLFRLRSLARFVLQPMPTRQKAEGRK